MDHFPECHSESEQRICFSPLFVIPKRSERISFASFLFVIPKCRARNLLLAFVFACHPERSRGTCFSLTPARSRPITTFRKCHSERAFARRIPTNPHPATPHQPSAAQTPSADSPYIQPTTEAGAPGLAFETRVSVAAQSLRRTERVSSTERLSSTKHLHPQFVSHLSLRAWLQPCRNRKNATGLRCYVLVKDSKRLIL